MLVMGIDDAGRGPLIGPMILAGVLIKQENEKLLKKEGVRDSKMLFHSKRIKLSHLIKDLSENYHIVKVSPEEIDNSIKNGINLNTLEAIKAAEIINFLNKKREKIKVIVDCPSNNISAWREKLSSYIKHKANLNLICEHKADANHPSVSAASILAKVTREEEMDKLRKEYFDYGDIGSGYPSDPITIQFLKKQGKNLNKSGIFRKSWATWKSLFPERGQSTLREF